MSIAAGHQQHCFATTRCPITCQHKHSLGDLETMRSSWLMLLFMCVCLLERRMIRQCFMMNCIISSLLLKREEVSECQFHCSQWCVILVLRFIIGAAPAYLNLPLCGRGACVCVCVMSECVTVCVFAVCK